MNKKFIFFWIIIALIVSGIFFSQSRKISSQPISAPISTETIPSAPVIQNPKDIALAEKTLTTYFDLLKTKQYSKAVEYHGSGYQLMESWNSGINPNDYASLLKNGCEINGLQCLRIQEVVKGEQISPFEFKFVVRFEKPEWSDGKETVFTRGIDGKTDFEYLVGNVNGKFMVLTAPPYVP